MVAPARSDLVTRGVLGAVGVLGIGYGVVRIFTDAKDTKPLAMLKWLIGSLLVHDVIIAPAVIGIGWLLGRYLAPRPRKYVQAALITGGLVSAIGVLLIWRQGKTSAQSLALLQQNYTVNLLILLAIVAAGYALAYLIEVSRSNRTNTRSSADQ
jgi:hypothetical protein